MKGNCMRDAASCQITLSACLQFVRRGVRTVHVRTVDDVSVS